MASSPTSNIKNSQSTFDDVYFDFNNDQIWPKTDDKTSYSSTPTKKRRSLSRSTNASSTRSRHSKKGQRSRQKKNKPGIRSNLTRPSSAPNQFISPAKIPGPFSFYTSNEIFVEDVYPHVKLDASYLQRPLLKRATTAPVQLINKNRKSRLKNIGRSSSSRKFHTPTVNNNSPKIHIIGSTASPLNPVPKSTEEIKKELKKAISTERKIKRMSPRTSKSTLNEKTIKQGMIENMLQRTALLSPAPAFEKRRPALPLNENMNFIPEKRVLQLRRNIKDRKKYNTELRIKIKQNTRNIKTMKRKNKRFQSKGLKHIYAAYKKEHLIGKKVIQENKLLLSHKNKIKSLFTDSEIEGDDHDEVAEDETAKKLRGLNYPDTDADSIFKNLPRGVDDLLEQQEKLLKKLLHQNANKIKYQPSALPIRPMSRSRKMRISGGFESMMNKYDDGNINNRSNPMKNKGTWAMMTFDKSTITKKTIKTLEGQKDKTPPRTTKK